MSTNTGIPTWLKWVFILETSLVVLLLSLFVILSVTGTSFKQQPITSYAECVVAKGSVIQESYPAKCVTDKGQTFIQPIEEAPSESSNSE